MFNIIWPKYDFLNHLLSGGIDIIWRKKAIKLLQNKGIKSVLDIATGTGDFAIEALKIKPEKIVGIDISEGMLAFGVEKIKKLGYDKIITLQKGDSEKIPFSDNSFDAITVSFGVRNYETLEKGPSDVKTLSKKTGLTQLETKEELRKLLQNVYAQRVQIGKGKYAMEDKGFYSFEFHNRGDKRRVYVLLHRERTHDGFYKVYLQDMKDMWKKDVYLAPNHIAKTQFYNFIESVIDDEYGLPF